MSLKKKPQTVSNKGNLLHNVLNLVKQTQPETDTSSEDIKGTTPQREKDSSTFIIVGLGNPGREYLGNRHNIGFMIVDHLAYRLGITFSRVQNRALVTDTKYQGVRLILVKPQTYMNESGQSVAPLVRFYKVPLENLLVIYDDMDIPLGDIRIRSKGGSSGQKGMKSIIQQLGNKQVFPRLRIGLGRPPGQMPPPAFLLQDFNNAEKEKLAFVLDTGVDAILTFVTTGLDAAMNQYNGTAT